MTFEQLHLTAPLLRAVGEAGYETPSPIQAKAIPPVLAGRDLLGCAQTGTGKTAAFALPMLQNLTARPARKKGAIRALILTPTRELALQIGESFAAYGKYEPLRCAVIFGGVGQQPQVDALRRGVDILVACPGRLNDLIGQGHIDLSSLEIFVLDEADRMLDMGFIHDVKRVIAKLPPKRQRQTLLFSATMPAEIERLADTLLQDPVTVKVDPVSSTVDRIAQSLYFVEKGNKKLLLPYLILHLDPPVTNALVFSRTKHGADKIARELARAGIPAAAIHGNKSQSARVAALEGFKAGRTRVLVATDIAARGIDISELAYVFNYDLPEVPETYVHRIGRTARAGADGCAVSFCAPEETEYLAGIEKLNRKKIPVVTGHPWEGVPALRAVVPQPLGKKAAGPQAPAARPLKTEQSGPAAAMPDPRTIQKREEESLMDQNDKPTAAPQGEGLSASAKRRRRRRRGKGGEGAPAAAPQAAAPAAKPARQNAAPQPKFDPRFLTPQAASQVQRAPAVQPAAPKQTAPKPAAPQQAAPKPAPQEPRRGRQNTAPQGRQPRPEAPKKPEREARPPRAEREKPRQEQKPPRAPARQNAPARREKAEDPGLLLIARRAPQQKFSSFEDYMAAHGGATAPIEDYADEQD